MALALSAVTETNAQLFGQTDTEATQSLDKVVVKSVDQYKPDVFLMNKICINGKRRLGSYFNGNYARKN